MNLIAESTQIGTVGELLVQLRLLEYDVQAASPLKDSGNDLIAVRGDVFRAIQVKTTTGNNYGRDNLDRLFHILAVVHLVGDEHTFHLDESKVFLIPKESVATVSSSIVQLGEFEIGTAQVDALFPRQTDTGSTNHDS